MVSERPRLLFLSALIAVTMWYYVVAVVRPAPQDAAAATMRLHSVQVSFTGLPEGWRAAADPPAVDIEMRWPASAILAIRPEDVRAIADLSALEAGRHRVTLRIQVPAGVTAVQATPPAVAVTLSRPAP
ncbi:MAG: hypothetical protein QN168_11260 [Armatimonadota bacterium]|nr:hypothetical protein [Armatimonadota bacterium]